MRAICIVLAIAIATLAQDCGPKADKGHACKDNKPAVKVYFDGETGQCLRFLYLGCGGNDNRFNDEGDCNGHCRLLDGSPCSGKAGPDCTPKPVLLGQESNEPVCPKGFTCRNGAGISTCCNDKEEEERENAYKPKCSNGKKPTPRSKSDDSPIFGKSCKDKFCPDGSTCHDAKVWAFCCPK